MKAVIWRGDRTLEIETLPEARLKLLAFSTSVEVLEPLELRESMGDFASRIAEFYQ